MGYVQRRRLSECAKIITANPGVRLLDLALEYNFASHEAFSRAFKRSFGTTPSEYQKTVRPISLHYQNEITQDTIDHIVKGISVDPEIIDLPSFHVVGLLGQYNDDTKSDIPTLWGQFFPRLGKIDNKLGNDLIGLSDCPDIYGSEFYYIAAAKTEETTNPPQGLVARTVAASTYAVFEHRVRQENLHLDLQKSLKYIWGTWLPRSKYRYTGANDFELYGPKFDGATMTGVIELYVPVAQ